ncbi:Oncoprotein-induced transcript 3 protein [Desmophyllum pertusum]|uniref:Oncoprotein-induced transcript 3 protein n=1 Tax=Desmophyllum pertusum TaxID=174260 RepID=A0A9X0CGZ1_9CNID|nr:Oncoprotein-induced transcript 3 protein [Desmophyllum pertusum]
MKSVFLLLSCLGLAATSTKLEGGTSDPTKKDNSKSVIINGETFRPGPKVVEDPRNTGPAYRTTDDMKEPAQDPARYGWTKHPFSWCTVQGRILISKNRSHPINSYQCKLSCEARNGCRAVEFWENYIFACFVCTNISKITPYTNKNDRAYPAHVWVQNEASTISTRKSTTPSLPPPNAEVNVTCGKNEMYISIPKKLLPGLDREHLRLTDLNCGATQTPTHFILRTNLTNCRTKIKHTKDFISYMNKVEEIPVAPNQIITRVREVEIPFSCYYSNTGVVSAVGLQVKSKKIIFSKRGHGEFVLEMKIFPDNSFLGQYKEKDFPVDVPLRKELFIEVSVDTEDGRVAIWLTSVLLLLTIPTKLD